MKQSVAFLLLLLTASIHGNAASSFAITESLPAAIAAGSVNVITGDHYFTEEDIVVQGAFPLRIPRTYISSSKSWKHFSHFFAYFGTEYYRECESDDQDRVRWIIEITEPNGTVLVFEGSPYGNQKKKHPIMFYLQSDRFNQGLTNTGKGEISARTNLKNVRIEMESGKKSFLFTAQMDLFDTIKR
ncbi:MAG: DUF6531 domain-containing protein [Rhabdochlamydiaceae bacterium]|jgi:hypothetical protein